MNLLPSGGRKLGPSDFADLLPALPLGASIPRIIHQTYSRLDAMTPAMRDNVAALKARNPGWDYRFYDDAQSRAFVLEHYGPEVASAMLRINEAYGPARADLFRYLVVYLCGGAYLDIKSNTQTPLDEIIRPDDAYLLSQWRNGAGEPHEGFGLWKELSALPGGEYQQWHIIAAPGHPFLRETIASVLANIHAYSPWRFGTGRKGVLALTGPIPYSLAIARLRNASPHRLVADETQLGLIYNALGEGGRSHITAQHYTQRTEPIVRRGALAVPSDAAYSVLKRGLIAFRRSRRGQQTV